MRHPLLLVAALLVLAVGLVLAAVRFGGDHGDDLTPAAAGTPTARPASTPTAAPSPTAAPMHPFVDRRTVGQPWGEVPGLLGFRGNPTRTWYGAGPVPTDPDVLWRYPEQAMCTDEVVGYETVPVPPSPGPGATPPPEPTTRREPIVKRWCGSGWTGQPAVWERPDGVTEVVFGAYDGAVHFLDARTGRPTRPPFQTGDIIKGSVTIDPDGFPLLYTGSRDGELRIIALDRDRPTQLWSLPANERGVWNDDWDSNPVVVDGLLFEGGEDSFLYAIELHRSRDDDGLVGVAPEVLLEYPGWTDELFRDIGDRNVSIESSVVVFEGRVYFTNSGGRVVGLDVSRLWTHGAAEATDVPVVFDFWMGDDVDATPVVDGDGMLYVAAELERHTARGEQVGQLVKLDPSDPDDPLVWGVAVPAGPGDEVGGIWATPALHEGLLYVTTHPGDLLVVDADTGEVVDRHDLGHHEWSSPVVVDDTLIVGACQRAGLLAFDLADPRRPEPTWSVQLPGCVESTPAVWDGRIHVGSRDGFFYTVGDP